MSTRIGAGLAVALLLAGCGFLNQQLAITSVDGCITKTCSDPDAQAHTQCEAACRTRYGGR